MSDRQQAPRKTRGRKRLNPNDDKSKKKEYADGWYIPYKPMEADPCDCPFADCMGCWYPCAKCGSPKCSTFCRRIRRSMEMYQAAIEWKVSK